MGFNMARKGFLAIYAAIILLPLSIVVYTSFKTSQELFADPFGLPRDPSLANYSEVLVGQDLATNVVNSVVVTGISVPLTVLLASMAAFAIARIPGWPSAFVFGAFLIGMAVPAQVNMIPQYVLFRELGLTNSLTGLVLINIVVTLPIGIFILTGFMKTLPKELFEAASVDGVPPWRTYANIVMPLSLPSVSALSIFLLVIHWNELLYPLLFITDPAKATLPKALLDFKGEYLTNYPLLFTGVLIASVPMVVAYVLLQRFFVAGMTAGAVKG